MNSTRRCPFLLRRSRAHEKNRRSTRTCCTHKRVAPKSNTNTVSIPFHRSNLTSAVSIELQLVFRLSKKAFDQPTLGVVAQDLFITQLPVGAQDAVKMFGCHRLIDFSSEQHYGIIETFQSAFVAIHAITIFPDRDEVSVVRFDIAGKRLGLDGDAFRIKNPAHLEHGDDVESLFQTSFHERLRGIPQIHQHINGTVYIQRRKHLDREFPLAFPSRPVIEAERKGKRLGLRVTMSQIRECPQMDIFSV